MGTSSSKNYIIVFQDDEGKVLKTSFVAEGTSAEPPEVPKIKEELEHHQVVFSGWDTSLENIQKNLVVKPVYEKIPKSYLVMYLSEEGKMMGMEKVSYGNSARQEIIPQKEDTDEYHYVFKGWTQPLDFIDQDKMVKPVFARRRKKYLVLFCGDGNEIVHKESVPYGALPSAPQDVTKEEDETFTYEFNGWDQGIVPVTGRAIYRAVFKNIYKEYSLSVWNEGEKIVEEVHHYGDKIRLPELYKKGYTLSWSDHDTCIRKNEEIHASWHFTNTKGKVCEDGSGVWRIMNPSIHNGSVSCVRYDSKEVIMKIPEKVKLGDYYYRIHTIEENAFCKCKRMKELVLPDGVEILEKRALAECTQLRKVTLGKGVKRLGKELCKGDKCLKEIVVNGTKLQKISAQVFDRFSGRVKITGKNLKPFQLKKLFYRGFSAGKVVI